MLDPPRCFHAACLHVLFAGKANVLCFSLSCCCCCRVARLRLLSCALMVTVRTEFMCAAGLLGGAESSAVHWDHRSGQERDHFRGSGEAERQQDCCAIHCQLQCTDPGHGHTGVLTRCRHCQQCQHDPEYCVSVNCTCMQGAVCQMQLTLLMYALAGKCRSCVLYSS